MPQYQILCVRVNCAIPRGTEGNTCNDLSTSPHDLFHHLKSLLFECQLCNVFHYQRSSVLKYRNCDQVQLYELIINIGYYHELLIE